MSINLKITKRDVSGKKAARKMRHEGLIPGVVYGDTKAPALVAIEEKELLAACYSLSFFGHVIEIDLGSGVEKVLPRDISFDTVTDLPIHVDFQRISKDSKVRVSIPIEFENEEKSPGLKKGGVINFVVHKLECFCSPESIPESIIIDLSGKDLGESFTLDKVSLPEGVVAAHPERDYILATIVASRTGAADGEGSESSTVAAS